MAQLRALEALLAKRRVVVARAYDLILSRKLWTILPDCASLEALCVVHLGMSQRTFQRYAEEGLRNSWCVGVRKEVMAGRLTLDRANFALARGAVDDLSLQSWVDLARQLGRAELHHAVEEEGDGDLREIYAPALAFAKSVRSILERLTEDPATATSAEAEATQTSAKAEAESEADATATSATAIRVASYLHRVRATGPILIARRDSPDERGPSPSEPAYLLAPPKLLAAAKYLLSVLVLPPQYGFRRTIEHDRHICQNPRCRRRTLRVHVHHIDERQHGGSDHPANTVTLCPACHFRGIHSGRMAVVRFGDFLVWTWPADGGVVLMHSPVSELE